MAQCLMLVEAALDDAVRLDAPAPGQASVAWLGLADVEASDQANGTGAPGESPDSGRESRAGDAASTIAPDASPGPLLWIYGSELDDLIVGTNVKDRIWGYDGDDTLLGGLDHDTLNGGYGNDSLVGGDGNDELSGVYGSDVLEGGEGDDYIEVSVTMLGIDGPDSVDGGPGIDHLWLSAYASDTGISFSLPDNLVDQVVLANGTLLANLERLRFSGSDIAGDNVGGGSFDDSLSGYGGDDTLAGNEGDDTLSGGAGADSLSGGQGDDSYVADGDDTIVEHGDEGFDTVRTTDSRVLEVNVEGLRLEGNSDLNGTGNASGNLLWGNAASNVLDGGAGDDTLVGGSGDDTLVGGTGDDALIGFGGPGVTEDPIFGFDGAEYMAGGTGNDRYKVDATDVIVENFNQGEDTVESVASRILPQHVEHLTLIGTHDSHGVGNGLDNRITGNSGDNRIVGRGGADTLTGGKGDDRYVVDSLDTVTELFNGGWDTVEAGVSWTLGKHLEGLSLTGSQRTNGTGNSLANALRGNAGANILNGAGGNDTLSGGAGRDTLFGGEGEDDFVFDAALSVLTNVDRVSDFTPGYDQIVLDQVIFTNVPPGILTADRFVGGPGITSAQDADQRIVYDTDTGRLYYDEDGAGGTGAVLFAVIGANVHPSLAANDFVAIA